MSGITGNSTNFPQIPGVECINMYSIAHNIHVSHVYKCNSAHRNVRRRNPHYAPFPFGCVLNLSSECVMNSARTLHAKRASGNLCTCQWPNNKHTDNIDRINTSLAETIISKICAFFFAGDSLSIAYAKGRRRVGEPPQTRRDAEKLFVSLGRARALAALYISMAVKYASSLRTWCSPQRNGRKHEAPSIFPVSM